MHHEAVLVGKDSSGRLVTVYRVDEDDFVRFHALVVREREGMIYQSREAWAYRNLRRAMATAQRLLAEEEPDGTTVSRTDAS